MCRVVSCFELNGPLNRSITHRPTKIGSSYAQVFISNLHILNEQIANGSSSNVS